MQRRPPRSTRPDPLVPYTSRCRSQVLVLQARYNRSDDQMEYQLRDPLSFMRFVGLGLGDAVPDAKPLWLYREALTQAGAVEGLFSQFDGYRKAKGYLAMGGQVIY